MTKSIGSQLISERVKAQHAIMLLTHYTAFLIRKHAAVIDPMVISSIEEVNNDILWLWSNAEQFVEQRLGPLAGISLAVPYMSKTWQQQESVKTLEHALSNYEEIQTMVDYEIQFIQFLHDMDAGDLARTSFRDLLQAHDDYLRSNPLTRTEIILNLMHKTQLGYDALESMAYYVFGSKRIDSPEMQSWFDSILEEINILYGAGEAAFSERRFKASKNNFMRALEAIDYGKNLLVFVKAHPEYWEDLDRMVDEFNIAYEEQRYDDSFRGIRP